MVYKPHYLKFRMSGLQFFFSILVTAAHHCNPGTVILCSRFQKFVQFMAAGSQAQASAHYQNFWCIFNVPAVIRIFLIFLISMAKRFFHRYAGNKNPGARNPFIHQLLHSLLASRKISVRVLCNPFTMGMNVCNASVQRDL